MSEMAFTTILRRSFSSGVPLAVREVQRNHHHSALFTALRHSSFSRQPSSRPVASILHFYSSSAMEPSSDDDLLRIINFEIISPKKSPLKCPDGFPFVVQDNPGKPTISISRKYQDELIEVEVQRAEESDDEYSEYDDYGVKEEPVINLNMTISKKHGPSLELCCRSCAEEIGIKTMWFKNPQVSEKQRAYQGRLRKATLWMRAFKTYLENRGFRPPLIKFLFAYMTKKDDNEYIMWLKNVKKFLEA